ncbi:recombinase XerD [Pseudomonas syringae]|nr:recombinase XerD [Pseudomonas syringae]PBP73151.1 recombinase XerD [Pseudomonas syringae]
MRVRRYQYNSLPFVAIVNDFDVPVDPYVSCYLHGPLASKSNNTVVRYANELMFALVHFTEKHIDLTSRVASGELISHKEYLEFYDRCCFGKCSTGEVLILTGHRISGKQLRNITVANQKNAVVVANETILGRIRQLRQYINWLFDQFHDPFVVERTIGLKLKKLTSKIKLDEDGLGSNYSKVTGNPEDTGLPDAVFLRLLSMVNPASSHNPFKSSKVRNYLIVSILTQSGIRRGAVAKLKISDLDMWGTFDQISIYRSINDPTDPRTEKPNQKTKSHKATISTELMMSLKYYIEHIRAQYPVASHDYIFVSESDTKKTLGHPLSVKSINGIFQKLSRSLGFHVYPHLLRHKWNETFDKAATIKGIDPALLEDVRKYAMGWSQNSTMNQIYNDKQLALKARELSLIYQKKVDH